jgi:hypothetical protein
MDLSFVDGEPGIFEKRKHGHIGARNTLNRLFTDLNETFDVFD